MAALFPRRTVLVTACIVSFIAAPSLAQGPDATVVATVATTVAPTTAPPTTSPPTTAAPTTAPPTTAPPTTEPSTTVPVTQPPQSVPVVTEPGSTVPSAPTTKPVPPTTKPTSVTTKPRAAVPLNASRPSAVPGGPTSIEVDISSQRLLLYKNGALFRAIHVSTGSGRHYCEKGKCGVAHTPRGRFRIYTRIGGWRTSQLGKLYNPLYFSGGYAIHGAGSVPNYPASHGCVRISMSTASWFPRAVPNGTPVWVHD